MHWYPRYVPVDEQRARTVSEMLELRARGVRVQPIEIRGRTIAQGFWGRRWCEHLESFSEHAARLAHGRAYVRNGSVCHLAIDAGGIDAMVVGSALYHVAIRIRQLDRATWTAIASACAGEIGSVRELREGRLPDRVVEVLTDRDAGLLPQPGEIVPECECSAPGDDVQACSRRAGRRRQPARRPPGDALPSARHRRGRADRHRPGAAEPGGGGRPPRPSAIARESS